MLQVISQVITDQCTKEQVLLNVIKCIFVKILKICILKKSVIIYIRYIYYLFVLLQIVHSV